MGRKEVIEKEIDLSELPRWESGKNKDNIKWSECNNKEVRFKYLNVKGSIKIIDYDNKTRKLNIEYENKRFEIYTGHFTECKLGSVLGVITGDFKIEIGTMFQDDKRDLVITDREIRKDSKGREWKWYKYTCNVCGWEEGWMTESDLSYEFNSYGCSCCSGRTLVQGINDIPTIAPWMVKYFQGGYDEAKLYTKNGGGNPNNRGGYIHPICPDCLRVKKTKSEIRTIYRVHSIGCSCSDSVKYPNKAMVSILEQLRVDFTPEYNPNWIKPKKYDFYIPSMNLIIEMDGGLGHGNEENLSNRTSKETLAIDEYKDRLANEHDIEVIRIDCNYENKDRFNYIKNSVLQNQRLNELFDLSIINWNKVNEYALSNLVKVACEYKRNDPNLTATEIGEIMKYHRTTIRRWLKQGEKVDWCKYNVKEESDKARLRTINTNKEKCSTPIICITTGDIFPSVSECERKSLEVFDVKLSSGLISAVCNGKRNHHHHLVFRKIEDLSEEELIKYNITTINK